ncbi:MAG: hypothetical protein PHP31_04975 [Lentimicrobiaceae bacterium]|nr:hypothetical protein [Lentimicrobiaceae bacterium]
MRNLSIISLITVLVVAFSLSFTSCGNKAPKADAVEQAADSTLNEAAIINLDDYTFEQKDDLVVAFEGKVAEMQAEIDRLTQESVEATEDVKLAKQVEIDALVAKIEIVKANIENIKNATAETYGNVIEGIKATCQQ